VLSLPLSLRLKLDMKRAMAQERVLPQVNPFLLCVKVSGAGRSGASGSATIYGTQSTESRYRYGHGSGTIYVTRSASYADGDGTG
jgi:hypothetical protein